MKKTFTAVLLFIIGFSGFANVSGQSKTTAKDPLFISTSDIHFDPFYDPTLISILLKTDHTAWEGYFKNASIVSAISTDHHDTNYPLFVSALKEMKARCAHPEYIIVTGDFLAHNFQSTLATYTQDTAIQKRFTAETIRYVAYMLNKYFPATVILPVLGNNDSYCGDYNMPPNSDFLSMFADTWAPLQRNHDTAKDNLFIRQFSNGGYYTYIPQNEPGHEMIFLNTIFFSKKYQSVCNSYTSYSTPPGEDELSWLGSQLKNNVSAGKKCKKIWMAYHIPPGDDVYSQTHGNLNATMWDTVFKPRFIKDLIDYKANIVANFAGHTHMDDFRVIYDQSATPVSFVHITPSISRSNGNYPGFQVVTYGNQYFQLKDDTTYYLNCQIGNNAWSQEYSFESAYNVKGINANSYDAIRTKMQNDAATKNLYILYNYVSNTANENGLMNYWTAYWGGTGITYRPTGK